MGPSSCEPPPPSLGSGPEMLACGQVGRAPSISRIINSVSRLCCPPCCTRGHPDGVVRPAVATGWFTVEPLSLRRTHMAKVTAASRLRDMEPVTSSVDSRSRYRCRYRLGRSSSRSSQRLPMITHLSARELLTLHEFKFHSLLLLEL